MLRSLTLPVPYRRSRNFPVHAIAIRPRAMFGQEDLIVDELRQAGVFYPQPEETPVIGPVRGEMPNRSGELKWIKQNRKECADQWVALDGYRLISHGTRGRELIAPPRAR